MNPHSFHELLRELLQERLPALNIRTPVHTDALTTPYLLLTCTGEEQVVPGNNTWECALAVELHTNAYDTDGADSRDLFARICAILMDKKLLDALNKRAGDFYIYTITQRSLDEPATEENEFIQYATFRVVIQF